MLGDGFGEQPALFKADVSGRRADQARHRVLLHVLAHVEANELDADAIRELASHLGLADTRGTGEQETAHRLPRSPRPERAILIAATSDSIAFLAVDHQLEIALEIAGGDFSLDGRPFAGGMRAIRATTSSMWGLGRRPAVSRSLIELQIQARPRLVDHVDGLVGQVPSLMCFAASSAAARDRLVRERDPVMLLETRLQAHAGCRWSRRPLAPPRRSSGSGAPARDPSRRMPRYSWGGRADAAQLALSEHRLEEIRGVHGAAGCGAGADHGVDLVDEQDGVGLLLELRDHALEPLLEVAAYLVPASSAPMSSD